MTDHQSHRKIKVECLFCGRYGEYREDRFFEIAGTDAAPPALQAFARKMQCPRAAQQNERRFDDRCKIQYRLDGLPSDRFLAGERRKRLGSGAP